MTKQRNKKDETLALLLGWERVESKEHVFKFCRELRHNEVDTDNINLFVRYPQSGARVGIVFGVAWAWATNAHDIVKYETNR